MLSAGMRYPESLPLGEWPAYKVDSTDYLDKPDRLAYSAFALTSRVSDHATTREQIHAPNAPLPRFAMSIRLQPALCLENGQ